MTHDKQDLFRKIPAVDRLLSTPALETALHQYPKTLVMKAVHRVLEHFRRQINEGPVPDVSDLNVDALSAHILERLRVLSKPSLRPVINATGVIVHTNLGRSILPERALRKFGPLAGGYSNLEYDLDKGKRGSRYVHVEGILKELSCAEAAMVVNNNAAAVLLVLDTLAKGREVVVARSQLVEIGGSFRVPDVMRKGGATMVEVGTTNKTHLRDYESVIGPDTALLMKVHRSNFQIVGFTQDVETSELVALGHKYGIPVVEDLGSGSFVDFSKYGLLKEPTVQEVLADGIDLVTFSGDKLLGGPQAGIILGKKDLVEAIKSNQFTRALRIDKLTLLALEETLIYYRDEEAAVRDIPTLRMMTQHYRTLKGKARGLVRRFGRLDTRNFTVETRDGNSKAGGGALPLLELPSRLVCLVPGALTASRMEQWLRAYDPPIIVRVENDQVLMDVRTIQEKELKVIARAVKEMALLRVP
jgi:L-seryl-tRNA(Ser) seleniumtransferase